MPASHSEHRPPQSIALAHGASQRVPQALLLSVSVVDALPIATHMSHSDSAPQSPSVLQAAPHATATALEHRFAMQLLQLATQSMSLRHSAPHAL